VEKGWNFCPFCGLRPDQAPQAFGGAVGGVFDKLMKRLAKQMEDIDRKNQRTDRNFEVIDLSPMFKDMKEIGQKKLKAMGKPGASGFSIRISRTNENNPKVDVKTYGNVDNEKIQKQVNEQLKRMGMEQYVRPASYRPPAEQQEGPEEQEGPKQGQGDKELPDSRRKGFPTPRYTEEPRTTVKRVNSRVFVDIEIPGVKSLRDVNIMELRNSIEVRAIAGTKAYFKILTIPEQFKLDKREFYKGMLHMEFA
jgi:HSP20 family molecular chaperone IbpA